MLLQVPLVAHVSEQPRCRSVREIRAPRHVRRVQGVINGALRPALNGADHVIIRIAPARRTLCEEPIRERWPAYK